MKDALDQRSRHEVEHGRRLAQGRPEQIWGWDSPAGKLRARRRGELIIKHAGLSPEMRVLELGCGSGHFTELFAATGAQISALDISPDLLKLAWQRNYGDRNVEFIQARFEDCQIEGRFDAVIGSSVLHHFDMVRAIQHIRKLLRPGGCMCFAEPNMLNPQVALQKNIPWLKARLGDTPDETAIIRWSLTRLLQRSGFSDIRIGPFDWLHPSTPRPLIPMVSRIGAFLERIPLIREISGSVLIFARKPERISDGD